MVDEMFDVHGLAELEDELAKLSKKAGTKVLRSSLMFASTPTLKAAKSKVAFDPHSDENGHIKDALGRASKVLRNGSVSLRLGERKSGGKIPANYRIHGHLLEFGSRNMAAQPFLRPAMEQTVGTVLSRFTKKFKGQVGLK